MDHSDEIICWRQRVSRKTIVDAVKNGSATLAEIASATGAGKGGRCKELNPKGTCRHPDIQSIISETYQPMKDLQ